MTLNDIIERFAEEFASVLNKHEMRDIDYLSFHFSGNVYVLDKHKVKISVGWNTIKLVCERCSLLLNIPIQPVVEGWLEDGRYMISATKKRNKIKDVNTDIMIIDEEETEVDNK